MFWKKYINNSDPLVDLEDLPDYAFIYVFRNLGSLKPLLWLLSSVAILSTLLRFTGVYVLSRIISEISVITLDDILYFYAPLWVGTLALSELLDYFTRRYAEALPTVFADITNLRFYHSYLDIKSSEVLNYSKERLINLTNTYVTHIKSFLMDWIWGILGKLVKLILIISILFYQNPFVLLINLTYIVIFLALAFRISFLFSPLAKAFSEQSIETNSTLTSFLLNLGTIKRLQAFQFFQDTSKSLVLKTWEELNKVKVFHAWRWLLQLNIFNALYAVTLIYGIYQVKIGELELGFLVFIKWSFDELWQILVYSIEHYVSLVQQREDARIIRAELAKLNKEKPIKNERATTFEQFEKLKLEDVHARYQYLSENTEIESRDIDIYLPKLTILHKDKIGLIGPSGSGKSSALNILQGIIPFTGQYLMNDKPVGLNDDLSKIFTLINNTDPLFKISLLDNILLGRNVQKGTLDKILEGCLINEFIDNINSLIGSASFNLSAGQEQRIRLARGLATPNPILLLDEAFNAIDQIKKDQIIAFLKEFLEEKTILLVTHNKDELKLVDKVYHFENHTLKN